MKIFFFYNSKRSHLYNGDIPFWPYYLNNKSICVRLAIISEKSTFEEFELSPAGPGPRGALPPYVANFFRYAGYHEVDEKTGHHLRIMFHNDRKRYDAVTMML